MLSGEIERILDYYRERIIQAGGYIDPNIEVVLDYSDPKGPFSLKGKGRVFVPTSECIAKRDACDALWSKLYVLSGQTDKVTPSFFRPDNRMTFTQYGLVPWIDLANHSNDAPKFIHRPDGIEIEAPEVNYGFIYP